MNCKRNSFISYLIVKIYIHKYKILDIHINMNGRNAHVSDVNLLYIEVTCELVFHRSISLLIFPWFGGDC